MLFLPKKWESLPRQAGGSVPILVVDTKSCGEAVLQVPSCEPEQELGSRQLARRAKGRRQFLPLRQFFLSLSLTRFVPARCQLEQFVIYPKPLLENREACAAPEHTP